MSCATPGEAARRVASSPRGLCLSPLLTLFPQQSVVLECDSAGSQEF